LLVRSKVARALTRPYTCVDVILSALTQWRLATRDIRGYVMTVTQENQVSAPGRSGCRM